MWPSSVVDSLVSLMISVYLPFFLSVCIVSLQSWCLLLASLLHNSLWELSLLKIGGLPSHLFLFDEPWYFIGYYQPLEGQETCDQCPAGFSCNTTSSELCTDGDVSPLGYADCTSCPQGKLVIFLSLQLQYLLYLKKNIDLWRLSPKSLIVYTNVLLQYHELV